MHRLPPLLTGRASCQLLQVAPADALSGICERAWVFTTTVDARPQVVPVLGISRLRTAFDSTGTGHRTR